MRAARSKWDDLTCPYAWDNFVSGAQAFYWLCGLGENIEKGAVASHSCNLIRCLWPSPFIERERMECESENCSKISPGRLKSNWHWECEDCDGKGFTLAPLINPRWRTPLVMDLARQVKGWRFDSTPYLNSSNPIYVDPNPELMPILADAMMDAGCELPEIIEHLKCGVHVPGECWVIRELLGESR
jgi:hypothetical protein